MDELIFEPMADVAAKVQRQDVSSVELTEAVIRQMDRWAAELNPFILRLPDLALELAQAADAEIAAGDYRGPLHGIPVVLKDLLDTAGIVTTAGSKVMADRAPEEDATVVRLLKEAGAVFTGKTNMPEFAANPTSSNPHYGHVRNPWNLAYDTAGSSSGTAAAIASGMAWCGPGSDTGGSIRMPAAATGLVGLKPTWGRVSIRGVVPLNAMLDHIGPLARTVRDAAILMQALAWYDEADIFSRDAPVDDYVSGLESGIDDLRVAVVRSNGQPVEPEIAAAFEQAVATVASAAACEEVDLSAYWQSDAEEGVLFLAAIYAHHGHYLLDRPADLSGYVLEDLIHGQRITGAQVIAALQQRLHRLHQIERRLRPYDLIVCPTLTVFPIEPGVRNHDLLRMTQLWDANGWPAATVPVGLSSKDLPIGFQIIGKPWQEALVLQAARFVEQAHGISYPPAGIAG